jgi:hypothetical protein
MCYDSICTVERVQQVSLNVMHHSENPIKWRDCSASSVLFRLRSIPFWKLKLALKGRRFGDSSTIQEQSAVRTVQKMVDIFIRDRSLTLRLQMSYIYGVPSKATNANVVYIWTYVWQRWICLFVFAARCFNTESMQRGFLCHICV